MGLSELGWTNWTDEIRRDAGRELLRSGMFPPSRYFREMSAQCLQRAASTAADGCSERAASTARTRRAPNAETNRGAA
jgi:hypothetical protein